MEECHATKAKNFPLFTLYQNAMFSLKRYVLEQHLLKDNNNKKKGKIKFIPYELSRVELIKINN